MPQWSHSRAAGGLPARRGGRSGLRPVFQRRPKRVSKNQRRCNIVLHSISALWSGAHLGFALVFSFGFFFQHSFRKPGTPIHHQSFHPFARPCMCRPDDPRPLQHPPIDGCEPGRACGRNGVLNAPKCPRFCRSAASARGSRVGVFIGSKSSWRNYEWCTRQSVEHV